MKFSVFLNEEDLVQFQLYTASKSKTIQQKRRKTRIRIPIFYFLFGFLIYFVNGLFPSIFFILFALLWYFYWPIRERKIYYKQFLTHVKEHSSDIINSELCIDINEENIQVNTDGTETFIQIKMLKEIIEIKNYVFLSLKNNSTYLVPKREVSDFYHLKSFFKEYAKKNQIVYKEEMEWVWK